MRKAITAVAFIIAMACLGWQSASAGLVGMPINMRVAIDATHSVTATGNPAACQRTTDDYLAGLVVINDC